MSQRIEKALEFTGKSDTGCTRTKNEDCITWDAKLGLAILADGMGGASAGDVAGQITAETVLKEMREAIDQHPYDLGLVDDGEKFNRASLMLCKSLIKANSVVHRIAQDQPECRGMGSTALTAMLYDNKISVGHVGDSRCYLLRDNKLTQLTEDHTILQEVINSGFYNNKEALQTVNRNIVTRAVGVSENLNIDIIEKDTLPGDLFLMCSDGLSDLVSNNELEKLMMAGIVNSNLAEHLVNVAINKGGSDNISVILIKVLKPYKSRRSFTQRVIEKFF
jgi:protein phosphatase